jgi:hypothetical protein
MILDSGRADDGSFAFLPSKGDDPAMRTDNLRSEKIVIPVVVLVPEDVAAEIEEAAARISDPATPEMIANGWTWEMLLAGRLLELHVAVCGFGAEVSR